ncbi:MAG: hypothetical protein QW613_08150 [Thermoprotei archaeon]
MVLGAPIHGFKLAVDNFYTYLNTVEAATQLFGSYHAYLSFGRYRISDKYRYADFKPVSRRANINGGV